MHTRDCPNLRVVDRNRLIPVDWNVDQQASHPVRVRVICTDKKGVLAAIAHSLSQSDINILAAQVETTPDRRAVGTFEVEVQDLRHLEKALSAIRRIDEVIEAERVRG